MKIRDGAPSRWPLLLALLLLMAAAGTLLWLRHRLVEGQQGELLRARQLFESTRVLGRPEARALVFADVATNANACVSNFIRRVYVVKKTREGDELLVHPYWVDLADPTWRTKASWTVIPIGTDDASGALYLELDGTALRIVDTVIGLIAVMLAAGLGILLVRQRGKERQLSRAIGELEERKAQVIQLERLALAGQLSANIFHDLKKPVLNIKHEVADALDGSIPADAALLQTVRAQTELFLQMLRDLGMESFVNIRRDEEEWCDLHEVMQRALRLVRYEQDSIGVVVDFEPPGEFFVSAIPHRLVQVFSNLALNAFQAMGSTGQLTVRGRRDNGHFVITLTDTGGGIAAERREEIFQPFVTSKSESGGSGLGLYICRTIVQDLGGTLSLPDPQPAGGSTFRITLPIPERPVVE